MTRSGKLAAVVALALALVIASAITLGLSSSKTSSARGTCELTVPKSSVDPMVFPTKSGSEALDAAIIGSDDAEIIRRVIAEQGGHRIAHGTACSTLQTGPVYSQVLVTEGPLAGKSVWAPTLHVHCG